mmetsp:Transcript_79575/g.207550  ORF Transcript_79575/g.207550 Transcript_79575/m.207550 type:complete len:118 (-) Transcript_79575:113-466(-)
MDAVAWGAMVRTAVPAVEMRAPEELDLLTIVAGAVAGARPEKHVGDVAAVPCALVLVIAVAVASLPLGSSARDWTSTGLACGCTGAHEAGGRSSAKATGSGASAPRGGGDACARLRP